MDSSIHTLVDNDNDDHSTTTTQTLLDPTLDDDDGLGR
jgi:hypothetical protein